MSGGRSLSDDMRGGSYSRGYPAQPRTRVRASGHLPVLKCPVLSGTDWKYARTRSRHSTNVRSALWRLCALGGGVEEVSRNFSQTFPDPPTLAHDAGRAGAVGGGPWALGPRAPAEGRCWTIGRSAPRRVVCARGCHCTALRPSRGAVAVRRGTGMLPGPRGRCGPGCRRPSSMLAQQHAAAPRR